MKKIVVIGCGFIGSHLAEELGKLFYSQDIFGVHVDFIDFDHWEDRNAANQHVSKTVAIKKEAKAITCANYFNSYFPDEQEPLGKAIVEKLTPDNAFEYLKEAQLVIDCVDNIPTRQLIAAFSKNGTSGPSLHIGISRDGNGMINWSSTILDTFPFPVETTAGREIKEQDIKEPPCEMYKYRSAGLVLVQAAAKAIAFFLGKDPWNMLDGVVEKGILTCWTTSVTKTTILTGPLYFINDFFPIYKEK